MFKLLFDIYFSNGLSTFINLINSSIFVAGILLIIKAFWHMTQSLREIRRFESAMRQPEHPSTKHEIEAFVLDGARFSPKGALATIVSSASMLSETSMQDKDILLHLEDVANEIRTAFPRAVPGLAVSIGFFGTVVGLFVGIYAMPSLFQGNGLNSDEGFQLLTVAMVQAIEGMKTAFGTTIVGLIHSLILTVCNLIYRVFWDKYDHQLKRITTMWIYPAFIVPEQENIVNHLVRVMEASRETLKTIEVSNSRLLNSMQSLAQGMEAYNRDNEKIIKQVSNVVREFMESQKGSRDAFESIKRISEQTQTSYGRIENLLDSARQDRESFMAYLQDSRNEIKEISTIQHNAYVNANRDFTNEQARLQKEARDSMMKAFDDLQAYLSEINDKFIKQNAELMNKTSGTVTSAGEAFTQKITQMKETLDSFKTEIVQNNQTYETETKKLVGTLAGLVAKVAETNSAYVSEN